MNVSLPAAQEHFVRAQVAAGRYRTASEVVRDGLRLLEEHEHRRLVQKWLYEDLSDEELALLPEDLKARARDHFTGMVEEAVRSGEQRGWVDGSEAMERLKARLEARRGP